MTATRRGVLALLGSAALAGCSATNPLGGDDETELDGAAIRAAVTADAPPSIPERLPVGIGDDHLAATRGRARSLIDAVPATLGPEQVPNGAIRERIGRRREHAVDSFDAAAEAATPFERLEAFAHARAEARFAAGAWRAIDEGLTREDLSDEADAVRADRRAFRERWQYVGGDPVTAVRVHAAIERRADPGRTDMAFGEPRRYRLGNPLGVGEIAEEIERARVAVDDAAHCYDRLVQSVDEPTPLHDRFVDARETLRDAFEAEREALPSVDPEQPWQVEGVDVEETPAEAALEELYRPVDPRRDDGWAETTPARALLWAHGSFVGLGAFASLRERVADGETFAVESAEDVAAMRSDAIEAVRTAADESSVPVLTRTMLTDVSARIGHTDERLSKADDDVTAARIRREVSTYLVAAARARATPAASERVAGALQ
ncbi:hypothetical protein [Haloplanus aerogenes]|uniref:Uncharacterized protein n=1 Tax=Haloplanus aerogenes TaxID=660522 RepID=A0A3M0CXI7_9EURY|nr:hypothetical protein [Haloplanus aerogenes]RMB13495.1 hypothetical protein ATH50_2833 [Haloplanus aerogenes]